MASVPSEAEKYCEAMYGDFMKLPPKEKRTVRHNTEYIDLHNSYTNYKGVYYLANEEVAIE